MFKKYKRKAIAELTPWRKEFDMTRISVSKEDAENGSPKEGDMVARNPQNHNDSWLVAKKYFEDNFDPTPIE